MKKLHLCMLVILLCFAGISKADPGPSKDFKAEVRLHLQSLPLKLKEELKLQVKFSLNSENEMEIISVNSEDPYVSKLIRKRLNGRKMISRLDTSVKEYTLPISISL